MDSRRDLLTDQLFQDFLRYIVTKIITSFESYGKITKGCG